MPFRRYATLPEETRWDPPVLHVEETLTATMTMARQFPYLLLLGAVACGGDKDSSGTEEVEYIDGGGTTTEECGGTAPVITSVTCENGGLAEYEQGQELPTLLFRTDVTDADADLENMTVSLYFDDTIDGSVSTAESVYGDTIIPIDTTTCVNDAAGFVLTVFVNGVSPVFNTAYEWSVVVRDANDVAAEPFIVECITPYENGDTGNGEG